MRLVVGPNPRFNPKGRRGLTMQGSPALLEIFGRGNRINFVCTSVRVTGKTGLGLVAENANHTKLPCARICIQSVRVKDTTW